jgi:hypothetical protein
MGSIRALRSQTKPGVSLKWIISRRVLYQYLGLL